MTGHACSFYGHVVDVSRASLPSSFAAPPLNLFPCKHHRVRGLAARLPGVGEEGTACCACSPCADRALTMCSPRAAFALLCFQPSEGKGAKTKGKGKKTPIEKIKNCRKRWYRPKMGRSV